MIYTKREILNTCFWDIETRPLTDHFKELSQHMQELWLEKYHAKYFEKYIEKKQKEEFNRSSIAEEGRYQKFSDVEITDYPSINTVYLESAALHAEFARIMCISMGFFIEVEDENEKKQIIETEIITFIDENEVEILNQFKQFLESDGAKSFNLGGYNIREFDIPFTTKRFLINNISLPPVFQLKGKKPWDIVIMDVCDDWRGLQREIVSLDLVCTVMGLPTPKDKFKNSEVVGLLLSGQITLKDVGEYCEKDVRAVMQVVLEKLTKK